MNILYTDEFCKQFTKLPLRIQSFYRKQEILFRVSSKDPRLHVKKLKGHPTIFSFRITRAYRGLFSFTDHQTVAMLTIGHRKDVYR
jgi:mRNA-degrading endonuclease RelE of RelBE toxin-antitoxin system